MAYFGLPRKLPELTPEGEAVVRHIDASRSLLKPTGMMALAALAGAGMGAKLDANSSALLLTTGVLFGVSVYLGTTCFRDSIRLERGLRAMGQEMDVPLTAGKSWLGQAPIEDIRRWAQQLEAAAPDGPGFRERLLNLRGKVAPSRKVGQVAPT